MLLHMGSRARSRHLPTHAAAGNRKTNEIKCSSCQSSLVFDSTTREVKCDPPEAKAKAA